MKEAGYVQITDVDSGTTNTPTLQCVHCGKHWICEPGSGKTRGWCMMCNGPVCGKKCEKCVPTEQLLENIEQGRQLDFRPVKVAIPKGIGE